jgi:thiamine biosynthesis lipoprotein
LLFEVVAFALQLAEQTDGAFDPTIGASLEQLGFNINYKTGQAIESQLDADAATFRDVRLDLHARTILLRRPLILDLNAVAKGLAIDLAARELGEFADVCVEAGGDVYVRGRNLAGEAWHIGIQHPRAEGLLAHTLHVTNTAVCTSGDYERRSSGGQSHILDARTRSAVSDLASVTVVAPTAMAADGLSTAAMVLGRVAGSGFLEGQGVGGVLVAPDGTTLTVNL